MSDAAESTPRVYVIHGDPEAAAYLMEALPHPGLEVLQTTPDELNGELRDQRFALAIVGGTIGSRGPLVMCEAVRMGRDSRVMVLTGRDVSPKAVEAHRGLGITGVSYFDFDAWMDPSGDLQELGQRFRTSVLEALEVAEDEASAEAARAAASERQAARQAAQSPANPGAAGGEPAEVEEVQPLEEVDVEPISGVAEGAPPPPFLTQLTNEDVEFATRLVERTKGIDFRAASSPLPPPQDSADAKALKLRERIRDLERQLARLAFVYRSRRKQFDQADGTITSLKQSRALLEQQIQQLHQEYQAQGQQREAAVKQREHEFGAMLAQAEQAFSQLKDQSAQTIANLQQQLANRQGELQAAHNEMQQLRQALESARLAQDSAASSREELVNSTLERERAANERVLAAEQKLSQEREAWIRERMELEAQVEEITGACSRYAEQVANAQARIEQLESSSAELESQLQRAQREHKEEQDETQRRLERMQEDHRRQVEEMQRRAQDEIHAAKSESAARVDQMRRMTESQQAEGQSATLAQIAKIEEEYTEKIEALRQELAQLREQSAAEKKELEATWSHKVDKLKESATVFRDAHQEAESKIKDREATIAALEGRLEERAREIERLMQAREDRGESELFDSRLRALEEAIGSVASQVAERVAQTVTPAEGGSEAAQELARLQETMAQLEARLSHASPAGTGGDLSRLESTLAQLESRLAEVNVSAGGEPPPALLERLDRLEQALREGGVPTAAGGNGMDSTLSERLAAIEAGLASLGGEAGAGELEPGALAARLDRWEEQLASLRGELGKGPVGGQLHGTDPRVVSAWDWVRATPLRGIIAASTVALVSALVVGLAVAAASGDGAASGSAQAEGEAAMAAVVPALGGDAAGDDAAGDRAGDDAGDQAGDAAGADVAADAAGDVAADAPADDDGAGEPALAGEGLEDAEQPAAAEADAQEAEAAADADEEAAAPEEDAAAPEPAQAQEVALAPTNGPLPPPQGGGSEATRKELRKNLLNAYRARRYSEAASFGLKLRNCCRLDWEAHLRLAESLEKAKQVPEAVQLYQSFAEAYPTNAFADDAMFRLGSILYTQGNKGTAKDWLEKVAANPASKHRKKAQTILSKL